MGIYVIMNASMHDTFGKHITY